MKKEKLKNPNAFPTQHTIDGNWNKEPKPELQGMTLRDYFAAKAMQSLIDKRDTSFTRGYMDIEKIELMCEHSYEISDAMLTQREH